MTSLTILPQEVLFSILLKLSPRDIIQFSLTSRENSEICNDPSLWSALCVRDYCVKPQSPTLAREFYRDVLHDKKMIQCRYFAREKDEEYAAGSPHSHTAHCI